MCASTLVVAAQSSATVTFREEVRPLSEDFVDYDLPTLVRDGRGVVICVNEFAFAGETLLNNLVTLRSDDHGDTWKNFTYVLPPATPDAPRALVAPFLARRPEALAVAWAEGIENPDGVPPAYAFWSAVTEDGGRTYAPAVVIAPQSPFGAVTRIAAFGPTPSGFAAVITSRDSGVFGPYAVSIHESTHPFSEWTQTSTLPDSATSIGSVDVWADDDGTLLAVGLAERIDVYQRSPGGGWSIVSSVETETRAHDPQIARDSTSGFTTLVWVDLRLPSVAYAVTTPALASGQWSAAETLMAPPPYDYVLPKLTAGSDGSFHLLLHQTLDRFGGGTCDIVYARAVQGNAWIVSPMPLNDPDRPLQVFKGADIIGGESIDLVWEDAPFFSESGIRFRTSAPPARVNRLRDTLPVVPLPNPLSGPGGSVSFRAPVAGDATLRLFGPTGRQIAAWPLGPVEPATTYVDWTHRPIRSGVYFWQVEVAAPDTVYVGGARQVIVR